MQQEGQGAHSLLLAVLLLSHIVLGPSRWGTC